MTGKKQIANCAVGRKTNALCQRGFTLIELMIVMLILAILVGMAALGLR